MDHGACVTLCSQTEAYDGQWEILHPSREMASGISGGPARWGGLRGASLDYVHAEEAEPHQLFTALCFLIGYDYDQLLIGPAASIPCYAVLTAPLNYKPEHTLPLHRRQERN